MAEPTLSETTVVSRAPNAAFRELEGKMFIVGARSSKLIMLNQTGTAVWASLDAPISLGEVADRLVKEFEVSRVSALEDCLSFARHLLDRELLVVER